MEKRPAAGETGAKVLSWVNAQGTRGGGGSTPAPPHVLAVGSCFAPKFGFVLMSLGWLLEPCEPQAPRSLALLYPKFWHDAGT